MKVSTWFRLTVCVVGIQRIRNPITCYLVSFAVILEMFQFGDGFFFNLIFLWYFDTALALKHV